MIDTNLRYRSILWMFLGGDIHVSKPLYHSQCASADDIRLPSIFYQVRAFDQCVFVVVSLIYGF